MPFGPGWVLKPSASIELLAALAEQRRALFAERLPVGALRHVARDVVRREQAAVGEAGDAGRVVRLAEAGEPLGRGQDVRLGEHGLELALRLLHRQLDRLRLRVGTEQVDRAVVDDRDHELDLRLALSRQEEVAQRLSRRLAV